MGLSRPYLACSLFTSLVFCSDGLLGIDNPHAHVLEPRRGRGGGSSDYYQSCEESYGSGYAQCYTPAVCFNQGGGEKCCEGGCTSNPPTWLSLATSLYRRSAVLTFVDEYRQLPKWSILRLRQLLLLLLGCTSLCSPSYACVSCHPICSNFTHTTSLSRSRHAHHRANDHFFNPLSCWSRHTHPNNAPNLTTSPRRHRTGNPVTQTPQPRPQSPPQPPTTHLQPPTLAPLTLAPTIA